MNDDDYEHPTMIVEEANEWQRRFLEMYVQNEDLKQRVKGYKEAMDKIDKTLHCIGGPLNDNFLGYSREQLKPFFRIAEIIRC